MNREKLENFLSENQNEIIGISVNDNYYNVNYILDYNLDEDNEPIVCSCDVADEETCFTMSDLLGMNKLEFYKRTKIEF